MKDEYERIEEWCLGAKDAADFLIQIAEVSQIADDFVDRDVPTENIDSQRMLRLLHITLVDIPANPFYRKFEKWLSPLISSSLLIWDATNDWKESKVRETRLFAYAYREIGEQIVYMTANILGGLPHARKVIREVHEYYHIEHKEDFSVWDRKESENG